MDLKKVAPTATFHDRYGWEAEDYFDDPNVIKLCQAIEANDIAEIDRLVAAGADVNAQGTGKMTPLLWAFPDNKLERFERLLEHGADPNVMVESDFGTRDNIRPGTSVTHMAAATSFRGYFNAVFSHGGNPNLVNECTGATGGRTPLFAVITSPATDKRERLKHLIEKGADTDHVDSSGLTPTMCAVGWGRQYGIALYLLELGADHSVCQWKSNARLVHIVIDDGNGVGASTWTQQQAADHRALLDWLESHGESLEQARKDRARWRSWSITTGEFRRNMDAEVAERKQREAREGDQSPKEVGK